MRPALVLKFKPVCLLICLIAASNCFSETAFGFLLFDLAGAGLNVFAIQLSNFLPLGFALRVFFGAMDLILRADFLGAMDLTRLADLFRFCLPCDFAGALPPCFPLREALYFFFNLRQPAC